MVRLETLFGLAPVLTLAAVLAGSAAPAARAMDKTISVVIDQAHLVDLPRGTSTLIIGNPTIADVTMVGSRGSLMVLTPKAFGETNFIALDDAGRPLSESIIRVVAGDDAVVLQRGLQRQSYACAPKCQVVGRLGDDVKYFTDAMEQAKSYSAGASGAPVAANAPAR